MSSGNVSLESVKLQNGSGAEGIYRLLQRIVEFQPSLEKVVDFVQPVELEKAMESRLMKREQCGHDKEDDQVEFCIETAEFVMRRSVNTSHPLFLNQLYGGVHPMGLAAAFISEKMNTNAYDIQLNVHY